MDVRLLGVRRPRARPAGPPQLIRRLPLPALLLALTGCLTASGPSHPAVVIRPTWSAVLPGDSTRLTPIGAAGDTLSGAPGLTWTSANPAIATIDASGRVRAHALGFTIVTATLPPPGAHAIAGILVTAPVLVGAGDIASCNFKPEANTGRLLDSIPGVVFTAGDNAYQDGTLEDFSICYEPAWGRHKNRTRPAPGNHEYHTLGAADYFTYFGPLAGDSGVGYYSYDLAGWHIISLNSNVPMTAGSPQEQWLRTDLSLHPAPCSLAYWHHARFSSGPHGTSGAAEPLWQALYDANADVVISGHDHTYERFAPQTPAGTLDPARGIREFVVGTGGAGLYEFSSIGPNSEFQNNTVHGVLKLSLRGDGYDWEFIAVGGTVIDSGSGICH